MQCIKCGKPVAEGEIFCAHCSLTPKDAKGGKRLQPKKVEPVAPSRLAEKPRHKPTLADALDPPSPSGAYASADRKRHRNFFPAFLIVLILAFGAVSYIAMMYSQWTDVSGLVNQVEGELEVYRKNIDSLQTELEETKLALEEQTVLYDNAIQTIGGLEEQLSTTENSVNQTQYDMTTQQSAFSELEIENKNLSTALEQANLNNEALSGEITTLTEGLEVLAESHTVLSEAYAFMYEHVVFVNDDGTNVYHRYDCSAFDKDSFWAYNRSLAESYGNTACPYCCED